MVFPIIDGCDIRLAIVPAVCRFPRFAADNFARVSSDGGIPGLPFRLALCFAFVSADAFRPVSVAAILARTSGDTGWPPLAFIDALIFARVSAECGARVVHAARSFALVDSEAFRPNIPHRASATL